MIADNKYHLYNVIRSNSYIVDLQEWDIRLRSISIFNILDSSCVKEIRGETF